MTPTRKTIFGQHIAAIAVVSVLFVTVEFLGGRAWWVYDVFAAQMIITAGIPISQVAQLEGRAS